MRQIQITIPNEKLHEVLDALLEINVKGIHVISGETDSLMIFRTHVERTADIIEKLNSTGVGVVSGIIDVLEVKATIPPLEVLSAKQEQKIESKLPVEEIYKELVDSSELSYRFFIFSLLAALAAGIGLIYNNGVIIIAAMVLAPLLGPILALSYSFVVKDHNLMKRAVKTELAGFLIAVSCGAILGIVFKGITPMLEPPLSIPLFPDIPFEFWLPEEILVRGDWDYIVINIFIAIIMGVAVGFSLTEGMAASAVGIAIGASLLPPIVNVGITLIIGEFELGLVSAILFLVNFLTITGTSIIIFELKKMRAPIKTYFLWRGPRLPKEKVEEEPPSVISRIFGRFKRKQQVEKKKVPKTTKKQRKDEKKIVKKEITKIEADIKSEIKEVVKEAIKEEIKKEDIGKTKKKTGKLEKEIKKEIQKAVKQAIKEEVKKKPEKEEKQKETPTIKKEEIKEVIKEALKEEIGNQSNIKENGKDKLEKKEIKEVIKEVLKEETKKEDRNDKSKKTKDEIKEAIKEVLKEETQKDPEKKNNKK
ncbi:MAG: TIGR00341 family protein [Candidatus Helarchaeota archaeon]